MQRIPFVARNNWQATAEHLGFAFHTIDGEPYWVEGMNQPVFYQFSLEQIENDIEDPTEEIEKLCYQLVDRVCNSPESDELLRKLQIPEAYWNAIRVSWNRGDRNLYGRYDFSYSGKGPAKMLEYNADTPTSLWETAYFQWLWLEEMQAEGKLPEDDDQFNSVQEQLIGALEYFASLGKVFYFSSVKDMPEDEGTVRYLMDCAEQAGCTVKFIYVEDIGLHNDVEFVDLEGASIELMFKLYPWENMMREGFGLAAARAVESGACQFVEPIWKSILSNKASLPLLWEMYPDHPNLLESYFDDGSKESQKLKATGRYARKPIFSREGANVELFNNGIHEVAEGGYGEEGYIVQALEPLPEFDGNHTVIGSWVVAGKPAGMGIREDNSAITKDSSRYIPHIIRN